MPAKVDDDKLSYSIGRRSYGSFRVANCEFFLLDTRGDRDMHDIRDRDKPGVSMIGKPQREWLLRSMRESDADFFFVVSTVPFMIPHSGAGGFEFDEENVNTFRTVITALRNAAQNPAWEFVSEGPEWWGHRVGKPANLRPVD